ncbi:MAG: S-methyl-5'-thioadenosine phosphorylase [Acidimicrobiia bacterium]
MAEGEAGGADEAPIGVIGGSGFARFLDGAEEVAVTTPYGEPSAPVALGEVGSRPVAFLPRHGAGHVHPPHGVPNRANVWALRELGVRRVLAPFAAGSLQPSIEPGDLVVVDQFVDRTAGRADTFHDRFTDGPQHASMADPYDAGLRAAVVAGAERLGFRVHPSGTVVVIQGPRFSTRAESRWYAAQGWELVNMTQYPEAALAREAGLAYAGIGLVTDRDAGTHEGDAVHQDEVFSAFERLLDRLRALLVDVIPRL